MNCWLLKIADQAQYADKLGHTYVFDNTHSVRLAAGDTFVYLDKRGGHYAFAGHGVVAKLQQRAPRKLELMRRKITRIFSAMLEDYDSYDPPLDISLRRREGRLNRSRLGITDANKLGWSGSVAAMHWKMFERIVELAYQQRSIAASPPDHSEYAVLDSWSFVRSRQAQERFKESVLSRQNYTCAICGTTVREVLEVAHISSYASDVSNRANPANGIGLCAFCHRAFDRDVFRITETGRVVYRRCSEPDPIASAHLRGLSDATRLQLMDGIDREILRRRVSEAQHN